MRRCIVGLLTALMLAAAAAGEKVGGGWKTHRSERFGFELSYPPETEYTAYTDKSGREISGGLLRDAETGDRLVEFEIWGADECPRQAGEMTAREFGIERAKVVTQADGPESSSTCGDPVTVREFATMSGATIYELELACTSESYPGGHDDSLESEPIATAEASIPVIKNVGTKGPTYFVDISPQWKKQILLADPVGNDPRTGPVKREINPALIRKILETAKTFPIQKPPGVCIEDIQQRGFAIGGPPH